ncbi:MAG: LPS-assembly protein LptD [Rhizobiaceae bacterium]
MGTGDARGLGRARKLLLAGVAATACLAGLGAFAPPVAHAQQADLGFTPSPGAQMLLEADTLIQDNDRNTISAVGGVQIDYDGIRLVAQRVTYDRNTNRLIAFGGVEIVDRDGNRFLADEIDITDDFRDGFVQTLRVETADNTFFAAESGERRDGEVTTFNRGVYTACEPCEERPDRPPIWRVGSQKIIWDGRARTVRFEGARFEFFGLPIAYLPFFEIPDPTVRQKSGFLTPDFGYQSDLGFSATVPYYLALAPTYDLTVQGTYYTRQGFLGEAEWRQRFENGGYNLRVAGIVQQSPDTFPGGVNSVNKNVRQRGMVSSTGRFDINPRWSFGWDVMAQTDKNFANTYQIEGNDSVVRTSQLYLTGLNDRNYFDLRGYHFQIQENAQDRRTDGSRNPFARSLRQPLVLPSFDYQMTPDEPVGGGELTVSLNAQSLHRSWLDRSSVDPTDPDQSQNLRGLDGTSTRLTAEAEWKRSIITQGGLVVTPLLHGRGDAIFTNFGHEARHALRPEASPAADVRAAYYRYMATAGMEVRWPVLFSTASAAHILEPIGQVFVRPDEPFGNSLGIPNEDAQSLVFDASTLFQRDKFSGFDRIEGGTRANLGFRYSGDLGGGWTTNAIFGQSYHLAGRNPYASPDLVNVGAYSGLQTRRSDYVGQVGLRTPRGLSFIAGARFDQANFSPRRADLTASYGDPFINMSARYSYIAAQPDYGFDRDRQEVSLTGSAQVAEYWRVFASGTYDFESSRMTSRSVGFTYDDGWCFLFTLAYTERHPVGANQEVSRSVGFRLSLRTLGDFGSATTMDSF